MYRDPVFDHLGLEGVEVGLDLAEELVGQT